MDHPPDGDDWVHEIKFDGYRMLCHVKDGHVTFHSRNDNDWTSRFPELTADAARLPARSAILDGEVVATLSNGISNFQALQNAFQQKRTGYLTYHAFDLLYLDGFDLRGVQLVDRKSLLRDLLERAGLARFRYSEHLVGDGRLFFQESCKLGWEGVVSKRADSVYASGRGTNWTKAKCVFKEEFVIGGYTEPSKSRKGLGALLVGYHEGPNRLVYAGRVGTGFSHSLLIDLRARLARLEQPRAPFSNFSGRSARDRGTHWVRPELVAQIEFRSWTSDGLLRQPSFLGLREDKSAAEVVRDRVAMAPEHLEQGLSRSGVEQPDSNNKHAQRRKPLKKRASKSSDSAQTSGRRPTAAAMKISAKLLQVLAKRQ